MVLHEQAKDISNNIVSIDTHLQNLNCDQYVIHIGPLIRREQVYKNDLMEDRKKLFGALFHFTRKLPISYICAKVKKNECADVVELTTKLTKSISKVLRDHVAYFESFDKIIVYYDNGQVELTKILTTLFNALLSNVEFRKVKPSEYKLFQVADLICTLELLLKKQQPLHSQIPNASFFIPNTISKKNTISTYRKNTFNHNPPQSASVKKK